MQKINRWGLAGTIFLMLMLGISALHYWFGDDLLFQSDWLSLFAYLGSAALVISPCIFLPLLGCRFFPQARGLAEQGLMLCFALTLVGACELSVMKTYLPQFNEPLWVIPIFLACTAAVVFGVDRQLLLGRLEKIGYLGILIVPIGVPFCIGFNYFASQASSSGNPNDKHLIYIVLDAFPAQYLNSYNSEASPTTLDEVLQSSHIYNGVRTTAPSTYVYFGSFYTGLLDARNATAKSPVKEGNLFASLQQNGVSTRWISWHRNGYPDCCSAQICDYKGLRSYFLSENYIWIPEYLGLDYHLSLDGPAPAHASRRQRRRCSLAKWLNGGDYSKYNNVLTECLIPQLRQQRSQQKNSLTLCHLAWYSVDKLDQEASELSGQEHVEDAKSILNTYVRKQDNRYLPEHEQLIQELNLRNVDRINALGIKYREFLTQLKSDPILKDSTVILTADHGSIYGKGKYLYGFHPNQEVIQVLCSVTGPNTSSKKDERLFTTPDLTASVLDFFGLNSSFAGKSHSLFSNGPGRVHTSTLTRKSELWKEWWMVLVKNGRKQWINLDPAGSGEIITYPLNTYDETPLTQDTSALTTREQIENAALIKSTLREYGIPPEAVHTAFRETTIK
jgi:hypothetical protein